MINKGETQTYLGGLSFVFIFWHFYTIFFSITKRPTPSLAHKLLKGLRQELNAKSTGCEFGQLRTGSTPCRIDTGTGQGPTKWPSKSSDGKQSIEP
jgi:hypothetical protein